MAEVRVARARMARAIEDARGVSRQDPDGARRSLERPAIALAHAVARCRCRELVSNADVDLVMSVAAEAVWVSLARLDFGLDTPQIVRFLSDRANHAVSDAARDADPLPRRARTYRNRVLSAASAVSSEVDERLLRHVATELYPQATPRTLELIVRGAPPTMELERAAAESMLPVSHDDPSRHVLAEAEVDAVHVTVADQPDPRFRAWAAKVLGGESDGRRIPRCLVDHVATAGRGLAAWV